MSAVCEDTPRYRSMTEADLEQVLAIERAGHPYPWSEGIFRDCLRVGYLCRVWTVGEAIRAYGIMSVAVGEAHVFNVCVHPDHRRRGWGRQTMIALLDDARRRGAHTAFLEVRPSNRGAIALYHDLGFNEVGLRPGYYPAPHGREDALVMARDL